MNDEQELLASAYLDGALTDEERARAEADPDVMAAVEQLGELRRAVSAVDPPNPARRDAAINAALKAFDADRRPTAPPPVRSLAGSRASTWFFGAAAAALVLVVAGGILATRGDQGGDDSAGGAAATSTTGGHVLADLSSGGAESTGGTDAAPQAREDAGATAGPATTAAPGTFAAAAPTTPTPQEARIPPVLTSPEELTAFAAQSGDAQVMAADGTRPPCHRGQWLGPAIYVLDGVDTHVDVFLARRAGEVRAVDPATCAILVTAPAS
jgi:hypothetical protein